MNMEELARKMDKSFIELRQLHKGEDGDDALLSTAFNLLKKLEERDQTIAALRRELEALKQERKDGR